jgi:hypothetical protein
MVTPVTAWGGPTRGVRTLLLVALAAAALSGCSAQTNPPSGVGTNAAILNGEMRCSSEMMGRWMWQWRELGTTDWSSATPFQADCPGATRPAYWLANLKPDTTYQYRVAIDLGQGSLAAVDSSGRPNRTDWETVTTQPSCDDVQGPSESLAAFVGSNAAGNPLRRRVLCIRQGTQDIGQLNGIKAWTTVTPQGEADGTKQAAVLNGNVALDNPGAAIEDVRILGCYGSPGCPATRDKVVDVTANDTALIHLDIAQRGGRVSNLQCVHVGSDHGQLTGVRMEYSKSHGCGSRFADHHYHGLYCRDALWPRIVGNWFYDNEGFGVQMYPNCDGAMAAGNVIAMNGGSCDLSGTGPSTQTSGAVYRNGFCGLARESGTFPPVHCFNAGANQVEDLVVYDVQQPRGVTDCGSGQLRQSGTYNANPQFVDAGSYDFRMQNPLARAKLGIYSEILPGPRW